MIERVRTCIKFVGDFVSTLTIKCMYSGHYPVYLAFKGCDTSWHPIAKCVHIWYIFTYYFTSCKGAFSWSSLKDIKLKIIETFSFEVYIKENSKSHCSKATCECRHILQNMGGVIYKICSILHGFIHSYGDCLESFGDFSNCKTI